MAKVTELQRLVGRITGRAGDTNFTQDSLDGLNQGLTEVFKVHPIRDQISTSSISVTEGDITGAIASTIDPYTIISIKASKDGVDEYYPLRIKTMEYMERVFPNALDTTQSVELSHVGRKGSTLHFNGSINSDYTIKLEVLSAETVLTTASTTVESRYDQALVHYSAYWIYSILEQEPQADRQLNLYGRAFQLAKNSEGRDRGTLFKLGMRPLAIRPQDELKPDYLDSDLGSVV